MNLVLTGLGTLASRLKPRHLIAAARRFLQSPSAQRIALSLRRTVHEAIRSGSTEILLVILRRVAAPKPPIVPAPKAISTHDTESVAS